MATTSDTKAEPRNMAEKHSPNQVPDLLDWDQAALRLGCTPRLIRKLVETRQVASIKVGKLVRIEPSAIKDYIERNRRNVVR